MKYFRALISTAVLITVSMAPAARGEVKENPKVDELAHDGYWVKTSKAYPKAMAMLKNPAPALELSDWHGKAVTAADMKGKIVLVDFWATWCGPCIAQIPHANEISKKYADKGVIVFGSCCVRGSEKMAATATEHQMEYPTGKLTDADTKGWGIGFWPTYAIIDRHGKLRAIGLRPDYVEKVLAELLVEQPEAAK